MSEYKRLTTQSEVCDLISLKAFDEGCGETDCREFCVPEGETPDCYKCPVQKAFNRLAQYEDNGSPEEFTELAKKKEYGNREFCRAIGCTLLSYFDSEIMVDVAKENCLHCKAYQFHDWLNKKGYKIIKFTKEEAEAALKQIGGN